nr:leucine-rich repeat-containing protein 15-like [Lytechinus pictus]
MVNLARFFVITTMTETLVLLVYVYENEAVVQECSDICDFYEWGKDAQCQGRNLESVPQECIHAKTLHLQDNRVSKLAQGSFRNFTCLKYLYLERNNMTVEVGSFEGCSMLEKIHLNQNHLPILTQLMLDGMPNVLYMFLDNASVHQIQPDSFGNLQHLKFLSLEDNRLETPTCDAFGPDNSLETLYLSQNNISNLPDNCFMDFSRLTKLYLKRNPLVNPNPLAFKGLDRLTLLDLQYTNLTEVPTGIFQNAINIEKLYLSYNNITHLSDRDFMSLYRLTHLYLHHNNIIVIQEQSFEFLGSLRLLDISFNRINSIAGNAFSHLINIREIKLQNNLLTSARNISFQALQSGTKLNLALNPLQCDCTLAPFLAWSKASSTNVLEDSPSQSNHARCSSPPALAGRFILSILHSDICPEESHIAFELLTQSAPEMEMEERIHVPPDVTSAFPTYMVVIVSAVVIVLVSVVIVTFVFCRKRLYGRKQLEDSETGIQITPNPLNTDVFRGRGHAALSSSPPPGLTDGANSPYYISLDGDSLCRSLGCHPLHHPMPPCFSSQSNVDVIDKPLKDLTQNDIVYSSVLPDGVLQNKTEADVINYTTVLPDEPRQEPRPPSMTDEEPIEEWLKNNFRFDTDPRPCGMTE